jgi:hypothetical protein
MKQGLIIAGFAVLSVVGLLGWTRQPATASLTATPAQFEQGVPTQAPMVYPATTAFYGQPAPVYSQRRTYSQPAVRRAATRSYVPAQTVARRQRPLKNSVVIVAASAGTGAAIGALAGGGKGAAIGALAGGAGGFIYDRITRNR